MSGEVENINGLKKSRVVMYAKDLAELTGFVMVLTFEL